jgi:transmembrane sensor
MSLRRSQLKPSDSPAEHAAAWVLRHDRGLTAAEQDEFSQWLAADPRNSAAWSEHRWGWDELDRLAGLRSPAKTISDPDLLAANPPHARGARFWRATALTVLAAAAVVAAGVFTRRALPARETMARHTPHFPAPIEQRDLPDGSVVELNRGAIVTERFTAGERRVQLALGEAHFKVAKDAQRPFVVEARGVAVRAVGTAFNVRIDASSVEVLVTEGVVNVAQPTESPDNGATPSNASTEPAPTRVERGERAIVSLIDASTGPQVGVLSAAAVSAQLAWQPRLLDFTDAPLPDILAEFNRSNPIRISLGDARLASLRLSATFRSDNVEGFVRLMLSDFGMRTEWRDESEIVLQRAEGP